MSIRSIVSSLFLLIILLTGAIPARAVPACSDLGQASQYSDPISRFEKFVNSQMALDRAVGLSIAFVKDDFTWAGGFGFADLENRVPARADSSYRLASVSKTFTAIAVLQLHEAGKLNLDADVRTYVPYFPQKKWPVLIQQVLGHIGGISHYRNYRTEGSIKLPKTTRQSLDIFKDFDLVAEPGSRYHYSSYGFNLLGAAVETVSGLAFGEYVRRNIFSPLGMEDTRMDDAVALIPNRVRGYRMVGNEIRNSEYVDISSRFAAGGTRSTVVDLIRYARGILQGRLLSEVTYRKMFTSQSTAKGLRTGYGMGWRVDPLRSHFQVNHGGSQPETRTHLLILPGLRYAVAIASNLEGLDLTPYIMRLTELILDEDINSVAHARDRDEQILYNACYQVYSHGLSYYKRFGRARSVEAAELTGAFGFFNRSCRLSRLKKDKKAASAEISRGIHQVSGSAFMKVGSYMAHALQEAMGRGILEKYRHEGPLSFFSDYIRVSRGWKKERRKYMLSRSLTQQVGRWQKDWDKAYTDFVRELRISADLDFETIGQRLDLLFSGLSLVPSFIQELTGIAQRFLRKDRIKKGKDMLKVSHDLYPRSPQVLSLYGLALLMDGENSLAGAMFKQAQRVDPADQSVSLNRISSYARMLESGKNFGAMIQLALIASELYPVNAGLVRQLGDLYYYTGNRDKAISYYKRALEMDPRQTKARMMLKKLEKEKDR